jgi:L-lysine exporter family protein LysE/ArgO
VIGVSSLNPYLLPALAGLVTGAGLIIAIGPQNVFVLRQGVRREHVGAVVAVCAVSDVVLIGAGVVGLGALVAARPGFVTAATIAGGCYLVVLGLMAARRAARPAGALTANPDDALAPSRWAAIGTAVALTWLNPHVYLDTVVTMGAIANGHGSGKWAFAVGACLASLLWFSALGGGATMLSGVFASVRAWRILDAVVAVIMLGMGVGLIVSA